MSSLAANCVLLADRHHRLIEGVRDLLESFTGSLFIVASETSLLEGAARLQPTLVVLDLSLVSGRLPEVLHRLRSSSPGTRTVLLTSHDEPSTARFALDADAHGVVLKRALATDLLPAIDAVLADRTYVSPGIARTRGDDPRHDP